MPAATADATPLLAEAARRQQLALRGQVVADTFRTWQLLDFANLSTTWPVWLRAMTAYLTHAHGTAADQGALFYRALRQHETGDPGSAAVADPPSEQWIARALGYSAAGVYQQRTQAGDSPEQATRSALAKTAGTSARIALDGNRTTVRDSVHADAKATGYYRLTDPDPCAFCALVAARGVVYKSEGTAGRNANERFTGDGLFKFHDLCGCVALPAFGKRVAITGPAAEADSLYYDHVDHLPNEERLAAFRKLWRDRQSA